MLRILNRAKLNDIILLPIWNCNDFLKNLVYNFVLAPNSFSCSFNPSISTLKASISYFSSSFLIFRVSLKVSALHIPIILYFPFLFSFSPSIFFPHQIYPQSIGAIFYVLKGRLSQLWV